MKKALALTLSLLLSLTMASCGKKQPQGSGEGKIKVAAILAGAINDGNWNETQFNGLEKIKEKGAETAYMENISDTDAGIGARTYADQGYSLIYLSTNSFQDYCTQVAEENKDVTLIQINGTVVTDNFISVRIADEEQGFMQGVIAALLSKTNKVGFIGGLEITPIKLGSEGFQQGVDYVNATYGKNVEAIRRNTGSMLDLNKAKETTLSMIESGCDVVAPMADDSSIGILEAAEEKGVMVIGTGVGQNEAAPTAIRSIVVKDVAVAYEVTYDAYIAGTLKQGDTPELYGMNKGVIYLSEWYNESEVDDDVKAKVEEVMEKLKNGEIAINIEVQ